MFGPRKRTGPLPRSTVPCSRRSMVGQSVAWVTSTPMPICGIDAVRGGGGAAQADLLLHRRHHEHGGVEGLAGEPLERLEHDEETGGVVELGTAEAAVGELAHAELDRHRVTDAHRALHLVGRGGAEIDPEIGDLGHLLAVFLGQQVRRLPADHATLRPRPWSTPPPLVRAGSAGPNPRSSARRRSRRRRCAGPSGRCGRSGRRAGCAAGRPGCAPRSRCRGRSVRTSSACSRAKSRTSACTCCS